MRSRRFWFGIAAAVAAGSPLILIGSSSVDTTPAVEVAAAPSPPATIFVPAKVPPTTSPRATTTTTTTTTTMPPTTTSTAPPAPIAGRCTEWEWLLELHRPQTGWDVIRMSRIAYRESNCRIDVRSRTNDTGLLQVNDVNHEFLSKRFGHPVTEELLYAPHMNVAAAAALCIYWQRQGAGCYQPWIATDKD